MQRTFAALALPLLFLFFPSLVALGWGSAVSSPWVEGMAVCPPSVDSVSTPSPSTPSPSTPSPSAPSLAVPLPSTTTSAPDSLRLPLRDHVSLTAEAMVGYMTPVAGLGEELLHSHTLAFYDLRFRYQTLPDSRSPFDALFRYPVLLAGISVGDLTHIDVYSKRRSYHSRLGWAIAPYFGFRRNLFQRGRWSLGYSILNGLSFNTTPYDKETNADNQYIGAHLSMLFALGVSVRYRLTPQWTLSVGADFKHNSAASVVRPNLGVNGFGPSVGVTYDLSPQPLLAPTQLPDAQTVADVRRQPFRRYLYGEFSASVIPKALPDYYNVYQTGDCPVFVAYNAMAGLMYRYRLHHASGLALDYTYVPYTDRLHELDALQRHDVIDGRTLRYSPHLLGLVLRHDVNYRHFSLNLGLGYFLHRRQGWRAETQESTIYQLIGFHYSLPFTYDRLSLGYVIKAYRFSKVDGIHLGLRLKFFKPKTP